MTALSRRERLKTRLEHEIDSRGVRLGVWLLRRTDGRIARLWRRRVMVLRTRGRRSGLARAIPIQYFPDGEAMVLVAANSGLPRPPAWYLNLTADPRAIAEVEGLQLRVRAVALDEQEAAAFWPRILEAAPDYERYPRRKGRIPPLVRLVPEPD